MRETSIGSYVVFSIKHLDLVSHLKFMSLWFGGVDYSCTKTDDRSVWNQRGDSFQIQTEDLQLHTIREIERMQSRDHPKLIVLWSK